MIPDLANMILLATGMGIGNAVDVSAQFYEMLGRVAARSAYHIKPGKDGTPLPTVECTFVLDVREFNKLKAPTSS